MFLVVLNGSQGPTSILPIRKTGKSSEKGCYICRFITSSYNYEPGSMTTILKQTKLEPDDRFLFNNPRVL
jgi:hypothetical protein